MVILIEVCVDSVESATAAVEGAADRLELCGNLGIGGGTTPSLGLFKQIHRIYPHIPVMVMIRPRIGDFVYTQAEMEVMLEDIELFKEAGANGVVFGVLTPVGEIDQTKLNILVQAAGGMQVCFHRAFDMSSDPFKAFSVLMRTPGVTRVLTSGHANSVLTGLPIFEILFKMLGEEPKDEKPTDMRLLEILPGSGVSPATVDGVLRALAPLGLRQVHMSGGKWFPGEMKYRKEGMGMGLNDREWCVWRTSREAVAQVHEALIQHK